jgi:hypothetical protein
VSSGLFNEGTLFADPSDEPRCAEHPESKLEWWGPHAVGCRHPGCGTRIALCEDSFGHKVCLLRKSHVGQLHVSASGSSWPVLPPKLTLEGATLARVQRRLADAALDHGVFATYYREDVRTLLALLGLDKDT